MAVRINSITFDCADPYRLAQFWLQLTGFSEDPDNGNAPDDPEALLLSPDGSLALLFIAVPEPKHVKNRVHLDLVPLTGRRDEKVGQLLRIGARMVDDQRRPDGGGWVALSDPEGNEFCIERSDAERAPLLEQLGRASDAVAGLISNTRAGQWSAPTPCTDWTVRQLVNHLIGMNRVFAALLAGQPPPPRPPADHAEDDPVGAVAGEPCSIQGLTGPFTPVRGVSLPASDPLALAAGGTSLAASHKTGSYISETAWGLPYGTPGTTFQASGGGFSHLFARPAYQDGMPGAGARRGVPDVSADASGHAGMALAISEGGGKTYLRNSGGTSATAPLWAGLIALANQYAGRRLGFVNPALYRIARSGSYHRAFHDITAGNNTVRFPPRTFPGYRAAPGWDPVTGLGSPSAQVLIPLLARYDRH
jgi:Glyoxalase-like domain/Mycothiol maleylpyruvate isomerase N-terminal domain